MTPEQWLDLIIERFGVQRIQSISVDGASVTLGPGDPPPSAGAGAVPSGPPERSLLDPFDDPETFGGVLPGYEFPASPPGALE